MDTSVDSFGGCSSSPLFPTHAAEELLPWLLDATRGDRGRLLTGSREVATGDPKEISWILGRLSVVEMVCRALENSFAENGGTAGVL